MDLFAVAHSVHKTATFFIFKKPSDDLMSSLMDNKRHEKVTIGNVVWYTVDKMSIDFMYYFGQSILYCNFQFNCMRFNQTSKQWEAIILINGSQQWWLSYIWNGQLEAGEWSGSEDNMHAKKVNRRNEDKFTAKHI